MKKAGVAHRDIKSENILIDPRTLRIRLIDYGLALCLPYLSEGDTGDTYTGTPIYMAPDVLAKCRPYHIISSDLWSAGIVLMEMLLGYQPFKDCPCIDDLIEAHFDLHSTFHRFDPSCQAIFRGVLCLKETRRMNLNKVARLLKLLGYEHKVSQQELPTPLRLKESCNV